MDGSRRGPRRFLAEAIAELRFVNWPSRRELVTYSSVVLITIAAITAFILAVDAISQSLFNVFGLD